MSVETVHHLVIDEDLIATAIRSVETAFLELFACKVKAGEHSIHAAYNSRGDISGILGMVQDRVEATLVITLEANTICKVLGRLYDKEFTEINESVKQGVGELTNIIYAGMKKTLNLKGYKFRMSIPTVVVGHDHSVYNLHQGETLVIPFVSDDGGFFVEIALQKL